MYYKQNYKNIIKAVEMDLTPKQASVDPKKIIEWSRKFEVFKINP